MTDDSNGWRFYVQVGSLTQTASSDQRYRSANEPPTAVRLYPQCGFTLRVLVSGGVVLHCGFHSMLDLDIFSF